MMAKGMRQEHMGGQAPAQGLQTVTASQAVAHRLWHLQFQRATKSLESSPL